ncbi:MAG: fumarylacetoacetate hydrolase family protein [Hyphomicrobiales bacterium]|nr:fumarylacetoacetate hydrolase family protein [Hyphomicrobiales bacterium]MDE2018660.1 fumarylacetoacetate hydrolase family protein [Hyphomicrobiales bacterium]
MAEDWVFAPPERPSIAVEGSSARFPVRRVFCVGRNYAEHAREMGGDPGREPPFVFMKPPDAAFDAALGVPYPPDTVDLHHEIELVVALGQGGVDVAPTRALDLVFGYAAGVDLTRRDQQARAKAAGRPWDWAKGFDRSAPMSPIRPVARTGHPATGRIRLSVNGAVRQDGDLAAMIWSVPELIAFVSRSMELRPGDLVMTGTPAGVGPLMRGDRVEGGIEGVGDLHFAVT